MVTPGIDIINWIRKLVEVVWRALFTPFFDDDNDDISSDIYLNFCILFKKVFFCIALVQHERKSLSLHQWFYYVFSHYCCCHAFFIIITNIGWLCFYIKNNERIRKWKNGEDINQSTACLECINFIVGAEVNFYLIVCDFMWRPFAYR